MTGRRRVKPVALGVSIFTLTMTWNLLAVQQSSGTVLNATLWGVAVGVAAAVATAALWAAWWFRSHRMLRAGLLLAAGLFAGRCAVAAIERQWAAAAFTVGAFAIAAGAYLLEADPARTDE